eukprot:5512028-Amphidinium_carterae.1
MPINEAQLSGHQGADQGHPISHAQLIEIASALTRKIPLLAADLAAPAFPGCRGFLPGQRRTQQNS